MKDVLQGFYDGIRSEFDSVVGMDLGRLSDIQAIKNDLNVIEAHLADFRDEPCHAYAREIRERAGEVFFLMNKLWPLEKISS